MRVRLTDRQKETGGMREIETEKQCEKVRVRGSEAQRLKGRLH